MGLEPAAALTLLLLALVSLAAVAATAIGALRAREPVRRDRPAGEMEPLTEPEAEKATRTSTARAASQRADLSPSTPHHNANRASDSAGPLSLAEVPCPVATHPTRQQHTAMQVKGSRRRFPAIITCSVKLQPETHGSGGIHLRLSADASAALSRRVVADLTTAAARLAPGLPGGFPSPTTPPSAGRPGALRLLRCGSPTRPSPRHHRHRTPTSAGGSALASSRGHGAPPPGAAEGFNDAGSYPGELVQPPRSASGAFQPSSEAIGGVSVSPAWEEGSSPDPLYLALHPRPTLIGSSGGSSPRPRAWWRRRGWTQARLVPAPGAAGAPALEELEEALTLVGGRSNMSAVCVPGCVQLLLTMWHNRPADGYGQQQQQSWTDEAPVPGAGDQPGHDAAAAQSPGPSQLTAGGAEGDGSSRSGSSSSGGRTSRASKARGHGGSPAIVEAVIRWVEGQGEGGSAWDLGYGADEAGSGEMPRGLQLQEVLGSLIRPLLLLSESSTPPLDQQALAELPRPPPAAATSSASDTGMASDSTGGSGGGGGGGGGVSVSYRYRRSACAMAWPLAVPMAAADCTSQAALPHAPLPPPLPTPSAGREVAGGGGSSGAVAPATVCGSRDGDGVLVALLRRRVVSRLSSVRSVLAGLCGEAELDETAELPPVVVVAQQAGAAAEAAAGATGREAWRDASGSGAEGSGCGGGQSGGGSGGGGLPGGGNEGGAGSVNGAGSEDNGEDDDEFVPVWWVTRVQRTGAWESGEGGRETSENGSSASNGAKDELGRVQTPFSASNHNKPSYRYGVCSNILCSIYALTRGLQGLRWCLYAGLDGSKQCVVSGFRAPGCW